MNYIQVEQAQIKKNLFFNLEKKHLNHYVNSMVMRIHCRLTAVKLEVLPDQFCNYLAMIYLTINSPQFTNPKQFLELTRFSLSILCCSFCLLRALWYSLGGGRVDFFRVVLLLLGFADCLDSSFNSLWFSRSICLTSSFVKE